MSAAKPVSRPTASSWQATGRHEAHRPERRPRPSAPRVPLGFSRFVRPEPPTVARLLGEIYRALGLLQRGHVVEADRAALVAGYIGRTARRRTDVLKQALGGVLFIDEAYTLASAEGHPHELTADDLHAATTPAAARTA